MNVSPTRRALLLVTLVSLPLAACGSGSSSGSAATSGSSRSTTAQAANGKSAFPRTVQTSHGAVTIKSAPKRIVVLGTSYAEGALALGAKPVAIDTSGAPFPPWLVGRTGSAKHQTLSTAKSVNIEAIAADKPDLIIAANWITSQGGVVDRLKAIAPTVDVPSKSYNPDWDTVIPAVADALGKPAAGAQLVTKLKKQMTDAGRGLPTGTTYDWVRFDSGGWGMGNGALLDAFGLKPAKGQDNSNTKTLSLERTNELTGDVVFVWAYGKTASDVTHAPGAAELPAAKRGTLQIVDQNVAVALNTPGAYGIPWLIRQIEPTLDKLKTR